MIKFRYKRKEPNNNVEKSANKDANSDTLGKRLNVTKKTITKTKELKSETSQNDIREDYLECIRAVVVSFSILFISYICSLQH